ncbi:MAG TPA: AAA family ATPase [Geminicoccaceae bacterium]
MLEVSRWLADQGLGHHAQAFAEHGIGGDILPELSDADLKELGLNLGDRKRLLKAIAMLDPEHARGRRERVEQPTAPAALRQAERRQLTVMFIDLVGSTELSAQLDPEDMGQVIRTYQGCCKEVVEGWGGQVAKYMGDGVLAYFGWPQAHEDEAERAVKAGLDLARGVARLGTPAGAGLEARVGIATGLVMVGESIGEGGAQEEAVVGETPNLAARLQALAAPGSVVISQATRRLVGGLFELDDLGPQRLRGFAEPVAAWRVGGEGRAEGRFEALHGQHLTPLVGREPELGILLERWAWAKDGDGQVVLLSGEPGIGKSRVIRTLRERLGDEPYTLLGHYCSPYHTNSVLHPVVDLLRRAAQLDRDDPPEEQLAKLEALLARSSDRVNEVLPLVAALLGVPSGDRWTVLPLTPEVQKRRTLEALVDQLAGLAAQQPVLALYDDVQWADPSTLELLELVIERAASLRVLVLITFRPEFSPPWGGEAHVTTMTMNRLGRRQGVAMVERIAGGKALPAEIVEQIVQRTDGIPLFVEELTKAVLESDLLRDTGDHFELAGLVPPLAIPSTLHDSLLARLDRLAPAKEVAQIGAVIGREFDHELLAAVAPLDAAQLQEALDQLLAAELIFRRGRPPEASYRFKHALVQDAAYQSLLRGKRQLLHTRIAAALEARPGATGSGEFQLLAHHYTQAGLVEKAVGYWLRAGRQATAQSANVEALAHLTKALKMLDLPAGADRDEKERVLQTTLGGILIATRGYGAREVEQAYARALQLCRRADDANEVFPVLRGLWSWHLVRAQFDRATGLAARLLELAENRRDDTHLLAAHRALGTTLFLTGRIAHAREHLERGVALHDPSRHGAYAALYGEDPGIACHLYAAWSDEWLGWRDRALRGMDQALALARQVSHPFSLAFALAFAARLHTQRREAEEAAERAAEAIELCQEQGIQQWLAYATITRGWALSAKGETEEGLALMRRGLDAWRGTGARDTAPFLAQLAEGCGGAGRVEEGLALLGEALAIVDGTGERFWEAELHRLRGELLARLPASGPAAVEVCLQQALGIARRQGARVWELRAATSLARLRRDQGRPAEAHDLLAPVYGWFSEGLDTADLQDAKALLDRLR